MNRVEPLPEIPSVHSQAFSSNSDDYSKTKENTRDSIPIDSNIPKNNPKNYLEKPKPIGIYNFRSNKESITSLEQNIDEVVTSFIEKNKYNIIECVAQEVQKKFDEKITPMSTEISNIKQDFISLYEEYSILLKYSLYDLSSYLVIIICFLLIDCNFSVN